MPSARDFYPRASQKDRETLSAKTETFLSGGALDLIGYLRMAGLITTLRDRARRDPSSRASQRRRRYSRRTRRSRHRESAPRVRLHTAEGTRSTPNDKPRHRARRA